MATKIWVNIGSNNGLTPDGIKPLPETILTYYHWGLMALTLDQFLRKFFETSIRKMFLQKYNGKITSTSLGDNDLTLWGRMMHVCVSKLSIIVSDKGLSPGRHQAIIWTNAGISLIGILRTNVSKILSKIHTFSFQEMHLKVSCTKWPLLHLSLNEFM